jgi:glycosyltransferase involved in cell wall biosynthesis
MPHSLLYLCATWPDPPGETFVHQELQDLAPHFDRVVVVPTEAGSPGEARDAPPNVEVRRDVRDAFLSTWSGLGPAGRLALGLRPAPWLLSEVARWRPSPFRTTVGELAQARLLANTIDSMVDLDGIDAAATFWFGRPATVLALLKRKRPGMPCFSRAHGKDVYAWRSGLPRLPFQRRAALAMTAVLPDSEAGVKHLRTVHAPVANRIHLGTLGVPSREEGPVVEDGVLRILSVSSIIDVKRVHLLAEALMLVKRSVHWTHVGDGAERPAIETTVEAMPDHVTVDLLGWLDHAVVLQRYADHPVDVFVNVSASEGLPVSIMEAFAAGVPAMVTAVGGNPEIVVEGAGHLLSSDPSPEEIATALDAWDASDRSRRAKAMDVQRTRFDSAVNQAAYADAIHNAIHAQR